MWPWVFPGIKAKQNFSKFPAVRIKDDHVQDHFKCYQLMTVMSENNEILVLDTKVVVS